MEAFACSKTYNIEFFTWWWSRSSCFYGICHYVRSQFGGPVPVLIRDRVPYQKHKCWLGQWSLFVRHSYLKSRRTNHRLPHVQAKVVHEQSPEYSLHPEEQVGHDSKALSDLSTRAFLLHGCQSNCKLSKNSWYWWGVLEHVLIINILASSNLTVLETKSNIK